MLELSKADSLLRVNYYLVILKINFVDILLGWHGNSRFIEHINFKGDKLSSWKINITFYRFSKNPLGINASKITTTTITTNKQENIIFEKNKQE